MFFQKYLHSFLSLLVLFSVFPLQGEASLPAQRAQVGVASDNSPCLHTDDTSTINIFIGGAWDSKHHTVSNYLDNLKKSPDGSPDGIINSHNSKYFYWEPESDIYYWILKHPTAKINIIGHSYGADTAATITSHIKERTGREVNLLITIDPVSVFRPNYKAVQQNSQQWINIMADQRLSFPREWFLFVGRRWRTRANHYIDTPLVDPSAHHGDVQKMMNLPRPSGKTPEQILKLDQ